MKGMSVLLCGVGGQGTVLASRLLARAAMRAGYFARTAETIGMAQRGGSVVSHVRWAKNADEIPSSLIPPGSADALIGFELGEAVRNLQYLQEDGFAVVSAEPVPSVLSALKGEPPDVGIYVDYLRENTGGLILMEGEVIARECGSTRSLNVALIGAACVRLGFDPDDMLAVLRECVRPDTYETNARAFNAGAGLAGTGGR